MLYEVITSNTIATRDARAEIVSNSITLDGILLENLELSELLQKHRDSNALVNSRNNFV